MKSNWITNKIKDVTVVDAYMAYIDGIDFICGDGKLKQISSDTPGHLQNLLMGKKGALII